MFTNEELNEAMTTATSVVEFQGGFDTLVFRKGFEESEFSASEKQSILDFISMNLSDNTYLSVKNQIDEQEFLFSEYYSAPQCSSNRPRQFRGAYAPVIKRTFAGLMELSLHQQRYRHNAT